MKEKGLLFFTLLAALVMGEDVPKTAIIGDSVMLECPIAPEDGTGVRWVDLVYNTDHNPQIIASNQVVNNTHPHYTNYRVDASSILTIITVSEEDAGEYRCETASEVFSYYLNTLGRPSCSGDPSAAEGSTVNLKCETPFSGGSIPEMTWFKLDENNSVLESTDQFSIQLARRDLELKAMADMDTTQVGCKVKMGEQEAECTVTLDVQYSVRDITVEPDLTEYPVGELIRCAASGNPVAEVKWTPSDNAKTEQGPGWSSIVPNLSLEGSTVTLTCTATNTVDGKDFEVTKEITFKAKEPLQPPPPPPKEEESKKQESKPEPNESASSSSSESNNNVLPIVGGILGGIVVLAIICAIVIGIKRKNSKPKGAQAVPTSEQEANKHGNQKGGVYLGNSLRYSELKDSSPKSKKFDHKKKDKNSSDYNRNTEESPLPWRKQNSSTYSDPRKV